MTNFISGFGAYCKNLLKTIGFLLMGIIYVPIAFVITCSYVLIKVLLGNSLESIKFSIGNFSMQNSAKPKPTLWDKNPVGYWNDDCAVIDINNEKWAILSAKFEKKQLFGVKVIWDDNDHSYHFIDKNFYKLDIYGNVLEEGTIDDLKNWFYSNEPEN